ncbi:RE1 [Symbiodinium sp. CCMP2592]|nr:RE1 [Symbiodinium sp. CCMP2592]
MPPATATATPAPTPAAESSSSFQLPWQAIPRFIPGTTDVTEYSKKLQFLAAMWPKEHLSLLAPRAALMCEGTAFKKVASLDAEFLKANDETGVKLLVSTLGGSWGKTDLEKKYDSFEKAIYGSTQKADETNDSYLARHDVHFEELLAGGVTLKEIRAYILLRQSQLSSDDRKRIVVEMGGTLEYGKVSQAIRLLGSRFFTDLQGQRNSKSKTYDANHVDENIDEEPDRGVPAAAAHFTDEGEADLDNEYIEALVAAEDQDALQVQAFEEELEGFFQDTPDLQDALVNYLEARNRLLAKKRARGFWPVGAGGKGSKGGRSAKGGKGKGKNAREQLLARISRSNCRLCGERGHWKAECPKLGKGSGHAGKSEMATTTVAEVDESNFATLDEAEVQIAEVCTSLPEGALTMEVVPSAATALISHGPIEAILDTGASRCVMGKQLVLGFLSQLEEQGNRALAVRFARLNEPQLRFTMDEIRTMPLEELGRFTIDFGKAMHGRSYVDVAENEKGWCKWIIEHMGQSEKRCHQAFIAYLERYVDQAEAVESALLDTMEAVLETEPSATRGRPKAAAKSISRPPAQSSEAVPEAWDLVNQDSSDPPLDHQVTSLATRVTHMESVLQQVLMAVQDLSAAFDPQVIEEPAKQLLDQQAPLPELKKFLRSIPWDKLKTHSAGTRTGLELLETEDNKTPAYVVFGMFVHGGKVGITRVSRDFPWLTQVLVRMIKLTDPHQQVTSITISRNTRSTPHRDSFNSLAIPNIVIPFEYPRAGGEIWIAQPPAANQQSKTLMCRGQEIDGSLQSLKSAVYVNPHKWHATMPWEGNRSVAIGYAVKPVWKLEASDRAWLLRQGFALPTCNHPAFPKVASRSIANAQRVCPESALRQELDASQHMLSKSSLANLASSVDAASKSAFSVAEDISWSTFQDSLLTYGQATGPRLDVLEIYASEDSRLTTWVRSLGGKAQRFTAKDGDLTTASGQRALWDLIQKTQPQHVWCSPDCRYWGLLLPVDTVPLQRLSPHNMICALPPTVAPWRISLGSRVAADGTRKYFCLGNEDRTTMSAERKKLRVPVVEVSITVLGDPKPDIEGWAPPPAAKESPSLIEAALEYQCDACLESTEPRHQRPSKLPEPKEFNELVGIDGFQFKSRSGYSVNVIHVLDEASCFHLGRRINTRHGSQAIKTVSEFWTSWAGQPRKIYLDPAGEFRSEEMLSVFQGMSARVFVSAAAWQRGRVERHGDIVKDMLARMDTQAPIINDDTFDQALLQVFQAKNALVRHQGYSPEQIVLGKSVRVPGSLTSDEDLSSHAITEGLDLEAEQHRQRLELRCQARRVFWEADNNQAIRRAILRRSNPVRGPYRPGDWVLYWLRKSSPNRLAAGRWHGPAKVICQEGLSIVWVSHGTTVLRCAPENLRPASLREWQSLAPSDHEGLHKNTGGSSSFVDLTVSNAPSAESSQSTAPSAIPEVGAPQATRANAPTPTEDPIEQPEHELTPQVSQGVDDAQEQSEVERGTTGSVVPAAPSPVPAPTSPEAFEPSASEAEIPNATNIPVPGSDEGLVVEDLLLASTPLSAEPGEADELMSFLTLQAGDQSSGPPLAEDNLPYVETPLDCAEHQAFCLEIPVNAKAVKRWAQEKSPEQMVALASLSKRARAEVFVKDLSAAERELFEVAKSKEIQCWLQTSAIKPILRQKLNPEQILKSRWILTWKAPEVGEVHQRAKARLVVLGFQHPKLVDVHRDAPTLSREGRALVLQTIASSKFLLSSFDIKTAFLRGKADANNPLAMEPPKEVRKALNLKEDEVCELLGNAYGRVDAPLLFYKELSKQLLQLGFVKHPLEPCVFMLYSGNTLNGILGVHVDDGVCGGDSKFTQKIKELESRLPFGSRKFQSFIFTGIHLEQFPDFSIRASQGDYVKNIPHIDVGRPRRQTPEAQVSETERTKLRGLIGSLQYAVTHTRPDMAAKLGELQHAITRASVQTLLTANKVLRETQEQAQVCVYYLPISVPELTFVSFGDASFVSSKNLNSHQGALVCATDGRLDQNLEAPLAPLTWTSKKIPRVVRSTLSAQAYAMSKAVDMLGWMRALWGVVHEPKFDWRSPEQGFQSLNPAIIVTDCKSLFDLVTRLAMPSCEEYRTTLEVLLIKQRRGENTRFRWIPTTLQAADCLTKNMDASLLRAVMAQGRFKLFDGSKTLEKDAQRKQAIQWLSNPPEEHIP